MSTVVREIGEEELPELTRVVRASGPHEDATPAGYVDWRRQAEDMAWLLAERDGRVVGGGFALVGWHLPRHLAIGRALVLEEERERGVGGAVLERIRAWAAGRGASELHGWVAEADAASLAWAERRGYREVGRESRLVLDLERAEPPPVAPPAGVTIITWAERPEAARGMYEVALEAAPDIPGNEDDELGTFEEWLSRDMQGIGDRPEGTFVALADGEVVGFAKFSYGSSAETAHHDLTGVKRAWRRRGVAAALKGAQIAWAKQAGFRRLVTGNEERNEPIRRLNQRYGYVVEPGRINVRGPISPAGP